MQDIDYRGIHSWRKTRCSTHSQTYLNLYPVTTSLALTILSRHAMSNTVRCVRGVERKQAENQSVMNRANESTKQLQYLLLVVMYSTPGDIVYTKLRLIR